jgi:hypothetical protein
VTRALSAVYCPLPSICRSHPLLKFVRKSTINQNRKKILIQRKVCPTGYNLRMPEGCNVTTFFNFVQELREFLVTSIAYSPVVVLGDGLTYMSDCRQGLDW